MEALTDTDEVRCRSRALGHILSILCAEIHLEELELQLALGGGVDRQQILDGIIVELDGSIPILWANIGKEVAAKHLNLCQRQTSVIHSFKDAIGQLITVRPYLAECDVAHQPIGKVVYIACVDIIIPAIADILIPFNQYNNIVVGVKTARMSELIEEAITEIGKYLD